MKKLNLKSWVVPALYVVSISVILISVVAIGRLMSTDYERAVSNNLVPNSVADINNNNIENPDQGHAVVEVTNETIVKPFKDEKVTVGKDYYDAEAEEDKQLNSLIFYKNTYMENTGILYKGEKEFEVISVLDGNVTSITKDDILGNVVEITHSNDLITVYHSLGTVNVKVGDYVKQNDVIGKSGKVNIDEGYENALLFEVNLKGQIINPNEFYNMNIQELLN